MKTIEPRRFSRNCTECKKARPNSFCDLPEPIFRKLSDLMICRRYTRGTAVFIEGQPPKGVYVLCSGRAKLSSYSEEGKAIILRVSESGEVLGLSAIVSGTPFEKTAHVIDDCLVGFIKRKDFIRFIETHHEAALNALHQMSGKVDALWLPGDTDVVTPQVFQYALRLQLERGLPVAAATRQQVHSGALMAADFSPRAAGRIAADLANRYLEGRSVPADPSELDLYSGARVTVNAQVARRLGVDVDALQKMGARVE